MENEMKTETEQEKRKRKSLLIMPLLVLPFVTMAFWALGGGQAIAEEGKEVKGFNNVLPDANLKDEKGLDKLSYYDMVKKADRPSNGDSILQNTLGANLPQGTIDPKAYAPMQYGGTSFNDPNEAKVYQKLEQLNQTLAQSQAPIYKEEGFMGNQKSEDVKRLEKMMLQMQQSQEAQEDPETAQLNQMLEKVLDIQYPERALEKIKMGNAIKMGQVYAVNNTKKENPISVLDANEVKKAKEAFNTNGFFSLSDIGDSAMEQNAISAVVHETQTIVTGSTVKLRLVEDITVNGKLIPKDNFVYGTASLNGERLMVKITGIRYNKSVFPIELSAMDIDGMDGIYIPGAIARDVAKQSADRAIQDVSFGNMSPSIGIQAAGAGLEAAKTLFSKKVKLIKVTVKAGYNILLRDEKQKQNN